MIKRTRSNLSRHLQEVVSPSREMVAREAIVEANPLNPQTQTNPVLFIQDTAGNRNTILVSCRVVPSNQYVLCKLADSPWIGDDYGYYKLPKIGEQVIVLFLHQDINSGVIVGRLNSIEELVPMTLDEFTTIRKDEHNNEEIWNANGSEFTDANGNIIATSETEINIEHKDNNSYLKLQSAIAEVESAMIKLGASASEAAVLGDAFRTLYNANVAIFNSHTHAGVMAGGGTTAPPSASQTSMSASELSTKVQIE